MASSGGLTRRRGGGGASAPGNEDSEASRVASPAPKTTDRTPETSYTGGENGHKIAFDPRDISESEERNKQPKLTLMEEVLLLGLKDKQVRVSTVREENDTALIVWASTRDTFHSGTITYHTLYEAASSLNWHSAVV